MKLKATLTLNKGRGSLTHNARTAHEKEQTWSDDLVQQNIWINARCMNANDLRGMYKDIFSDALDAYNAKQVQKGHSERQIDDYYDKIKHSKQEHLTYSFVYQIGELDHIVKGSEDEKQCIDALEDIAKSFEERNHAFKVAQSVIHNDEKGIAHLHLVFIPVSSGNKRGLETKNSFVGALKDMGYKDKDNFKQWRTTEVEACNQIMLEHGIERVQSKNHDNLIHDMDIYKQMKAEEEQMAQITPKKTILGRMTDKVELSTVQHETLLRMAKKGLKFDATKNQLAKDAQINAKKSAELENQKNDFLNQRKKSNYEIMQKEKELSVKEKQLDAWEKDLDQREASISEFEHKQEDIEELAEDGYMFRSFVECLANTAYKHQQFFEDHLNPILEKLGNHFAEDSGVRRFVQLLNESYKEVVYEHEMEEEETYGMHM
jgi:hypothetical protein|nr:hypothetical protein [uncultured Lachnoclostridium sp.]